MASSFNRRIKRGIQSGKYKVVPTPEKGLIQVIDKKGMEIAVKRTDIKELQHYNQPLHRP